VINLKTAQALGITVSPKILLQITEVSSRRSHPNPPIRPSWCECEASGEARACAALDKKSRRWHSWPTTGWGLLMAMQARETREAVFPLNVALPFDATPAEHAACQARLQDMLYAIFRRVRQTGGTVADDMMLLEDYLKHDRMKWREVRLPRFRRHLIARPPRARFGSLRSQPG
jgi:hypothetical protein